MLSPKKVKYRKQQKGRLKGKALRGNTLTFGNFGLVALAPGFITNRQIESARIAISRHANRGGDLFIKIFPHKSLTRKPAEVRMGSGKGNPELWVAVVKPGRILFELRGVDKVTAKRALSLARYKLPIKTKVIEKEEVAGEEKVEPVITKKKIVVVAEKAKEVAKPKVAEKPKAAEKQKGKA